MAPTCCDDLPLDMISGIRLLSPAMPCCNDLPWDMIPEILCTLPVASLLRFRSVSKEWNVLIDCYYLLDNIEIVKEYEAYGFGAHHVTYELDRRHRSLWASCRGLLVFWNRFEKGCCTCIVNPITGENRDISTPRSLKGYPCGFFFDRFQGRYKLLYADVSIPNCAFDVYYTFDLSENMWRELDSIKYPLDSRPNWQYPGVIVGDALHWIVDCPNDRPCSKTIVVFKIETEEFYSLPHPPVNNGGNSVSATTTCDFPIHESFMQLIAKDGKLCFCQVSVEEIAVDLWILEDYENWGSWVKKFKVNLVSINKRFRGMTSRNPGILLMDLRIGSPENGSKEILVTCIYSSFAGFYGYHLETHCSRQLETTMPNGHMSDFVVLPYTKTMLSPRSWVTSCFLIPKQCHRLWFGFNSRNE